MGKKLAFTVELQWLEHWLLFTKAVSSSFLSPSEKSDSCRFDIFFGDFLLYTENGMLCVLNRIALMRLFYCDQTTYPLVKENRNYIPIIPTGLALWLTLISSNYPCLEHCFMVQKVFEPVLKFYCSYLRYKRKENFNLQSVACGVKLCTFICWYLIVYFLSKGLPESLTFQLKNGYPLIHK